ncbi:transglycosylase domain-containing protein [Candidatus Margulisiibacteriota bacterium]
MINLLKKAFSFFLVMFLIGTVFAGGLVFYASRNLPDVNAISVMIPAETTKIISYDGQILAELHREENRIAVEKLEDIAPILMKTVIATEDTDFYKHHGINIRGILRAFYRNILAGGFVEGGSTLTQQLARNLFLHRKRKIMRKISEMVLAIQIERHYAKSEILKMYLNQVYWGHNTYGIQSASNYYFGKKAKDLNLPESALLVGMLKGPELYSPFRNYLYSKRRQKTVLDRMAKINLISQKAAEGAYKQKLNFKKQKTFKYKAPFFTSYVVKQLISMYGEEAVYTSGMTVYTTLDYELQQKAEKIVEKYIEFAKKPVWFRDEGKVPSLNFNQGALLAIEPVTGYIKTMQGGADFKANEFNRTTQAKRQPGSAFKPFVYLTALEKGFSPGTYIEDSPVTYNTSEGPYSPQNYTKEFLGLLPVRKALEKSVNVIAIKLNHLVGPKNVVRVARQLGVTSPLKPVLSLPLGANEVSMLELASVYGVLANGGRRVEPVAILKIEDRDGVILHEHRIQEKKVFDANLVYTLVDMMKGVVKYGTGRNANLPRPIAGKTGTTSDYRDAWFIGFVPQLVTAVWVGNDDNTEMRRITGGWVPALMWKEFMKQALEDLPAQDFPHPKGLVGVKVNKNTGKLANAFTPEEDVMVERYWKGSAPKEEDTLHKELGNKEDNNSVLDFFR